METEIFSFLDVDGENEVDTVKRNATLILKHSTAYPIHQGFNYLRCLFCSERFHDPTLFRNHMDSQHKDVDKTIPLKTFDSILRRVDITNLHCKDCAKVFLSLDTLAAHLNDEHDLTIDVDQGLGLVPLKLEKDRFECLVCNKRFSGAFLLSKHTGIHFCKYICEICGKHLETPGGFRLHVERHKLKDKYVCKRCKKSFPTAAAKKQHLVANKSCLPNKCPFCKERFSHVELRDNHLVSAHGKQKKVYPCTKCDKVFRYRAALYVHFKATHTEDYKCQHCEKKFPTQAFLQEHIFRYHTDERPFKCAVCDAYFHSNLSLKRHSLLHDESRRLTCYVCNHYFFRKDRLKAHIQRHHPEFSQTSS